MSSKDHGGPFDEGISPLSEVAEPELHLDMDLDDMEGIVDPNLANAPVQTSVPPRSIPGASTSTTTDTLSGTSLGLSDALTFGGGTSVSDSSLSSSGSAPMQGRSVVSEAHRMSGPFSKDPFAVPSGVPDGKRALPASPTSMSPKHSLPIGAQNQPRRPSQLRNVKMGSIDSEVSSDSPEDPLLAPAWVGVVSQNQGTVFNTDPFGTSRPAATLPSELSPSKPGINVTAGTPLAPHEQAFPTVPGLQDTPRGSADGALAPPGGAAWAAPESWGVEGDEDEPEVSESSAEDEEEEWEGESVKDNRDQLTPDSLASKKPPPFGYKSINGVGVNGNKVVPKSTGGRPSTSSGPKKPKNRDGRPSTSTRPGTSGGRPGTAGSQQVAPIVRIRVEEC